MNDDVRTRKGSDVTATVDVPRASRTSSAGPPGRPRRPGPWSAITGILGSIIPVFFLGTIATFVLGQLSGLSPAYLQLGEAATPEAVAQIEHEWGLDQPIPVQYVTWLSGLLRGDLGTSWYNGESISALLVDRAIVSLSVAGIALVIGVVVGFTLGAVAAARQGTWIDRAVTGFCAVISTMPAFVVGVLLVAVVAVGLHWLPSAGFLPIEAGLWPWLSHLLLPALALSFDTVSDVARQLRTGLVTVQHQNYVIGARLRGFSERRIFFRHVLRNGTAPAIAILGLKFPNLLGGAVVTEAIFGLPGYGVFASESALRGDVPAVQGVLVVSIVIVVVFNVLVNLILNRLAPAGARGV